MKKLKKVKAGAIQYVLVVSVIIMIVLAGFISLVFLQNKVQLKSELYQHTLQNCYAAFDYLSQKEIPYNTPTELQFSEFDYEHTTLVKKRWGLFDIAIATSKLRNERNIQVGLMGSHNNKRKALFLKDNNQPLKLVGDTRIVGDVVLPQRGVHSGNIAGTSYYGKKLIYGSIKNSSEQLPNIKNIAYIKQLVKEYPPENTTLINLEDKANIRQSFLEKTLMFKTSLPIMLREMSFSGNIVLISDSEIQVSASTKLNHVILIAPKIYIQQGFKGNLQAFASEQLTVSSQTKLTYPSSLSLINLKKEKEEANIQLLIKSKADVRGVVLYHGDSRENSYKTQLKIEQKATVTGEVYCNKNLELNGNVNGYVHTNNFITKQFGSVYMNHIFNGVIDSKSISEHYAGLLMNNGELNVAQWIE